MVAWRRDHNQGHYKLESAAGNHRLVHYDTKIHTHFLPLQETTDTIIKNLYFKHLFTQPYHKAFTTSEVGVERMRKELYAFHGDADAFRIISETYDEYEKCRLKSIKMFSSLQIALTVRKGSPYKEHIRQR
jgi:hypothetical protein